MTARSFPVGMNESSIAQHEEIIGKADEVYLLFGFIHLDGLGPAWPLDKARAEPLG